LDGFINIDKPAGITSFGVVARLRRWSGQRQVGHAGTLDPDATGVLPVCLGQATRLVEFLVNTTKTYRAVVALGAATDTYDASGRITESGDPSGITRKQLEEALGQFRGTIRQTPPMYSAVKHRGRPLYKLARAGVSVARPSRTVKIHRLELIAFRPPLLTLEVECGKGTYIRSLAHDLGQALGCGAHLKNLTRTRCGIFAIEDAVSLERLEEAFSRGSAEEFIHPPDSILGDLPAAVISEADEPALRNGSPLSLDIEVSEPPPRYWRAYAEDGRLLGILVYEPETGVWRPKKVLV
jgi:tRNA pseudouridine55 synthase